MQGYELAFIVDADVAEDKREKIVSTVTKLIETQGGNLGELEVWGKRDFSFPINHKAAGVYYLQYFQIEPKFIIEIDKRLKIDTHVVRYLLVRQQKRKIKKSKPRSGMKRYVPPTAIAV